MIRFLEHDFDKELTNGKVLVDFYADWCGPCRMLGVTLEELKDIDILKVNVDKFPEVATKFGVMSIPALFLIENGNIKNTHVGLLNKDDLIKFTE